ncbi:MAG: carboxymuconolactone decarboxylase family protein [Proteobacteria bacterium]|nr:carboxymuconolactone decarboxylase family protein [Pseudomonadota bacterium]
MTDTPTDIFDDTGCRLPVPDRDALDAEGQAAFDRIVKKEGGAVMGLRGPTAITLHSPEVGRLYGYLNRYLRFDSGIDAAERELLILVAARESDSGFEWAAQKAMALKGGLPQSTIDVVKFGKALDGVPADHALLIDYGRQVLRDHTVSPETFAQLEAAYGPRGVVDLASLLGNYVATAILLTTVDAQLPPDDQTQMPVPL